MKTELTHVITDTAENSNITHWILPGLLICKYQAGQKWPVPH